MSRINRVSKVSKMNKVILGAPSLLLCLLLSANAMADNNPNGAVSIGVNPEQAQSVPTNGTNPEALALNAEANQQSQQRAVSKGKTYVANAPDPNNSAYWAQKNSQIAEDEESQQQDISKENNQPVNQQRMEKESQGLKNILTQWNTQKPTFQSVLFEGGNYSQQNGAGGEGKNNAFHAVTALPGTLWYATMADGADSYVPGVVRVQLQEGPFAGGYALGKFQIAPDGEHLILTFNTLSFGNTSIPISAVAIDPHSQIPGVTGDIDHHFMVRYVIPGAMGFLQGAVELLKANSTVVVNGTTSTVSGPKLTDAQLGLLMASSAADRLQDATTPQGVLKLPEVKIAPGAGVGFLLLKSV